MALTSVKLATQGAVISFRSKDPTDTTNWIGTLESVGTYRSIRPYGDPRARNESVRQTDPSIPSDVTVLTYFLITVENNSTQPTTMLFADEWIEAGSLNEVLLGNQVKILVDDPGNNTQQILSILANAGYACRVIS